MRMPLGTVVNPPCALGAGCTPGTLGSMQLEKEEEMVRFWFFNCA
jgi:hypothetical protein